MSNWLQSLKLGIEELYSQNLIRTLKVRETPNALSVSLNGKSYQSFCSNDYLALSNHPLLIEALSEGARIYGVGSGASSLISGHTKAHALLEERLSNTQARHIPNVASHFVTTGFMANLAAITVLATIGSISIYSDALNHASLIDAIRLAKASSIATVHVYPHSDYAKLQQLLELDTNSHKLIVTDSVFSMDGDIADLPKLLQIANQHQALLYIDDAHGFGVLGNFGHGSLEHFNLCSENIIYMGTLGKAAGVSGAFIAAGKEWIDWFIQKSRPIIYSTSSSPAIAHAILTSLDIIEGAEGIERRQQLNTAISYWNVNADFVHMRALKSPTAIQPLVIGDNQTTLKISKYLQDLGYWIPAIRPPTVPINTSRLRITLNADHQASHLQALIDDLKNAAL